MILLIYLIVGNVLDGGERLSEFLFLFLGKYWKNANFSKSLLLLLCMSLRKYSQSVATYQGIDLLAILVHP